MYSYHAVLIRSTVDRGSDLHRLGGTPSQVLFDDVLKNRLRRRELNKILAAEQTAHRMPNELGRWDRLKHVTSIVTQLHCL
jgi:hypothetical protein